MKPDDTGWKKAAPGRYERRWNDIDAIVWQDKELWRNSVAFQGTVIDMGEWDSREQAFRNARGAMLRAIKLRSLSRYGKDFDDDEDDS